MAAAAVAHDPIVFCPFPSAVSPYADRVQQATMAWAHSYTLVRSTRALQRLDRLQYGSFMGRAYPTASEKPLKLVADWNTWLFLLDDEFDEHALGHNPTELARLHSGFLAIMHGEVPQAHQDTRYHALYDLMVRFHELRDAIWMRRFVRCVEATLAASVWEAHNRAGQRVPLEAEYLHMRPFTSAMLCFLSLMEVAEQFTLPAAVRQHPLIRGLSLMTSNIVGWFNDLASYTKEVARGDVHNLVYIVHQERRISLDDAVRYVVTKHDAEVRAFQRVCANLPSFGHNDKLVQRYLGGLEAWIRANVDWSMETARYRPAARQVEYESARLLERAVAA
jgi:terpene synthase-like protein